MRASELSGRFLPDINYMTRQTDINPRMRSILVDWLIELFPRFHLQSETLFIAVNIIDRFLMKMLVFRPRLQLLGVTAMHIACKYQEIYAPNVHDLIFWTDDAYEINDVSQMETLVL